MKQKLGLACTLVRPPRLLLLDEPTVGVDPVSRRELWQIVYRLVRQERMTVLFSTAYLDEAERCEEVFLMHEGELVGQGPPAAFCAPCGAAPAWSAPRAPQARELQARSRGARRDRCADPGRRVRLVMSATPPPSRLPFCRRWPGVPLQPVPPRLEDAFINPARRRQPRARPLARSRAGPAARRRGR